MRNDCPICTAAILEGQRTLELKSDDYFSSNKGGTYEVHYACAPQEEKKVERKESSQSEEKIINVEDDNTGSVITDIRLPFERVLSITFQFFIAGLIIATPFWIVLILIAS